MWIGFDYQAASISCGVRPVVRLGLQQMSLMRLHPIDNDNYISITLLLYQPTSCSDTEAVATATAKAMPCRYPMRL